jgi:short-subunit dehydrogenase
MAFAHKLAPRYDLLLVARSEERLRALAAELAARHGAQVDVFAADLTEPRALEAVADRIGTLGTLGLLVNNAGFGHRAAFWDADLAVIEAMHRLHVMAIVRLTHAALSVLVAKNGGAVINVASVAAFGQRAGNAAYGATKAWLTAFSEGLYLDLAQARSAVKVQALCPGFTYSGFHDLLGENRRQLAPASLWLTAEEVVDESLAALSGGGLIVVPGWRYRLLVGLLTKLPLRLKLYLEARSGSR